MNRIQKIAVTSGISAFLLALFSPGLLVSLLWMLENEKPRIIVRMLLGLLFLYISPPLLMAIGAYNHSIQGKKSGFGLVIVGAVIMIFELLIYLLGLPYEFLISDWVQRTFAILHLLPGILAIVTLTTSAMVRARVRPIS